MDSRLTSLHWDDILFVHLLPYLEMNNLFTLRSCSKECKEMIDNYFGEMKELRLDCSNFTVMRFKILSLTCHNLRKLIIKNCNNVSDDDLKYLLSHNRKIKHLDLTSCCKLTSLCLQPVIIHFKDLNSLILNENSWLTSGCLEAFSLHHSKLKVLELSHCSSLGDVTVINSFLVKCKDLHTLDLSGIDCITDATMETLSHFNLKLRILKIRYCPRVTDYGLRMVTEYCKELNFLSLLGCSASVQRLMYNDRMQLQIPEIEADIENLMTLCVYHPIGVPPIMLQI